MHAISCCFVFNLQLGNSYDLFHFPLNVVCLGLGQIPPDVSEATLSRECTGRQGSGGRFKNAYELLNLRALKIPMLYKN